MISILTHTNPDGDAVGAAFFARALLAAEGCAATVYLFGDLPRWFGAAHALLGAPPFRTGPAPAGPCWLLDAPALSRCGAGNVAEQDIKMLIDHHPADPATRAAAAVVVVNESATSACELLAWEARSIRGWQPSPDAAGWLYLGMRTDSLAFATSETSAWTHDLAAWLIHRGAPHAELAALLRRSLTRDHLAFQAAALARAAYLGDVLLLSVSASERRRYGVGENDCKMLLSIAGQLADVDLVVLAFDADDGATLVSARSATAGRAAALACALGGGGHPRAAGARVASGLDDVVIQISGLLQGQS